LNPPTTFDDNFFDVVYGISIFTHLSESNHDAWYNELIRILAPGGILYLTTHGDVFCDKLTTKEKATYNEGKLVVRGKAIEGHRVYAAFHPPSYIRTLFGQQATILKHIEGKRTDWGMEQDVWVVRK
jgi:SAM-dependent methyltransferase